MKSIATIIAAVHVLPSTVAAEKQTKAIDQSSIKFLPSPTIPCNNMSEDKQCPTTPLNQQPSNPLSNAYEFSAGSGYVIVPQHSADRYTSSKCTSDNITCQKNCMMRCEAYLNKYFELKIIPEANKKDDYCCQWSSGNRAQCTLSWKSASNDVLANASGGLRGGVGSSFCKESNPAPSSLRTVQAKFDWGAISTIDGQIPMTSQAALDALKPKTTMWTIPQKFVNMDYTVEQLDDKLSISTADIMRRDAKFGCEHVLASVPVNEAKDVIDKKIDFSCCDYREASTGRGAKDLEAKEKGEKPPEGLTQLYGARCRKKHNAKEDWDCVPTGIDEDNAEDTCAIIERSVILIVTLTIGLPVFFIICGIVFYLYKHGNPFGHKHDPVEEVIRKSSSQEVTQATINVVSRLSQQEVEYEKNKNSGGLSQIVPAGGDDVPVMQEQPSVPGAVP